jgi:hypothetical protein
MMNLARIACLAVSLVSTSVPAATIWYEDNNLGRAGQMPDDFIEKFHKPETFARATTYMNVYMLRAIVLQKMEDEFFTQLLLPYLEKNRIKLAINAGGATWLGTSERRQQIFEREIELLERIKRLGGRVDYISLQSILSKPRREGGRSGEIVEWPLEDRIRGAVTYARAAQRVFPEAAIGIIDSLPSKGKEYQDAYRQLATAMKDAGSTLAYVHLDLSFSAAKTGRNGADWAKVREIERYLESDLNVQFGLFAKSRNAGQRSSAAFRHAAIAQVQCYSGSGGTPRDYVLASWFKYPDKTIPENATGDEYPAMRILLELGEELRKIEQGGADWVTEQQSNSAWMSRCGLTR